MSSTTVINDTLSEVWRGLGGAASYTGSPNKLLIAAHRAGHKAIRLIDVQRFLKRQSSYTTRRQIRQSHQRPVGRFMVTGQPGETWSADTIYLPKGTFSNFSLALSFIDNHSRFAFIFPQVKSSAENTKKAFLKAVEQNGGIIPKVLITDRGTEFLGVFKTLLTGMGVKHVQTSFWAPNKISFLLLLTSLNIFLVLCLCS